MICVARKRHFARSCEGTFFQVSKYLCASSIACRAISAVAFWKTPMISVGREGFVDVLFSVVVTFFPFSHIGYSRPNSAFTFFSASSIRARFSAFVKSINGSFVNSETCTTCSAVAMTPSSSISNHPILLRPETPRQAARRGLRLSLPAVRVFTVLMEKTAVLKSANLCRSKPLSTIVGHTPITLLFVLQLGILAEHITGSNSIWTGRGLSRAAVWMNSTQVDSGLAELAAKQSESMPVGPRQTARAS